MEPNVWVKACHDGSCVEVKWLSACSSGACVEVSHVDGRVLVRDSKRGDKSPVIVYRVDDWRTVLEDAAGGVVPIGLYFDESPPTVVWVWTALDQREDELARLEFTPEEWDEFVVGVKAGTFVVPS